MNALVYVYNHRTDHSKNKETLNEEKKYVGFCIIKIVANFEAFR